MMVGFNALLRTAYRKASDVVTIRNIWEKAPCSSE